MFVDPQIHTVKTTHYQTSPSIVAGNKNKCIFFESQPHYDINKEGKYILYFLRVLAFYSYALQLRQHILRHLSERAAGKMFLVRSTFLTQSQRGVY